MLEPFEPEPHQAPESDWDRAILEAQKQFALQEAMDTLEDPYASEIQKREIYRRLGAVLVIVSIPVLAIVAAKKISKLLRERHSKSSSTPPTLT